MGKLYIYGMGKMGIRTFLYLRERGEIVTAFVDGSCLKQKRKFEGVPCVSVERYKNEMKSDDKLILAINDLDVFTEVKRNFKNVVYYREIVGDFEGAIEPIDNINDLMNLHRIIMNENERNECSIRK